MREGCAIVTGSARGIGAATATALAGEGWPVVVNYRSDGESAEALAGRIGDDGGRAVAVSADVTDPEQIDALFERAESELGPVLVLVNNAGMRADGLAPQLGRRAVADACSRPTSRPPFTPPAGRCARCCAPATGGSSTSPRSSAREPTPGSPTTPLRRPA